MSPTEVLRLEAAAYRAWPAAEVVDLGGWKLRHTEGVTRRGNSVSPRAIQGGMLLEARIGKVEAFYQSRGLAPLFQLGGCPVPQDLDATLERRGYAIEAEVTVQTAAPGRVLGHVPDFGFTCVTTNSPTDAWRSVAVGESRFAAVPRVLDGFLERLKGRCRFVLASRRGAPACAALLVLEPPYVGLFSMVTAPRHRRQGAGRAVVRAAATWAEAQPRCSQMYLLVESDNAPAVALYRQSGFVAQYGYHYRRLRA